MGESGFGISGDFEFAPVIVWDALVDQELVSGWLADATIVPVLGGEYLLHPSALAETPIATGLIVGFNAARELAIETSDGRHVSFVLRELAGGLRGTSTRLRIDVDLPVDPGKIDRERAAWQLALDRLDGLLRGHPADWAAVERTRVDRSVRPRLGG